MPIRVTWLSDFNPPKFFSFRTPIFDDTRREEVDAVASDGTTTAPAMEEALAVVAIVVRKRERDRERRKEAEEWLWRQSERES